MSLSSAVRRNDYVGASSTSIFAYSFRIFAQGDLVVQVMNTTTEVITTLTINTDYTVSGVGSSSGGNVTLLSAGQAWLSGGNLATGYTLTIRRVVSIVQNTDIRNQGPFLPATHEDAFDYFVMIDQQQQDSIDGCVKLPATILPSAFDPTLPLNIDDSAGSALLVNSSGNGFVMGTTMFSFFNQAAQPANPAAGVLAFWLDRGTGQLNIWNEIDQAWRAIA